MTHKDSAAKGANGASERFGAAFEKGAVGQVLTGLDGQFLRVNAAFARMLKYPRVELEQLTVDEVTHPDDQTVSGDAVGHLIADGEATRFEKRYLARDGTTVWADVNVALVQDRDGRPDYFVGTMVDVTERRQTERQLDASEKRYRRLFEAAKDGILILDAGNGKIVDVNPYLTSLTGYSREDFLDKHVWEIGPFSDVSAAKDAFAELQTEKYVRYEDLPLRARDGRRIDVEFVSNVYRVDDHSVIQCNIRDITERKQADAVRDRLMAAIEQVAEAVIVTDVTGGILYVNAAFEAVTGYSRAEVLGENPRLLKSGVQDESLYRTLWETISSGKTWQGRLVNCRKDGLHYTEEATISPMRDATGAITSYVAVKRDITAELGFEALLLQSQKMEGIGRLAGGVAHDFNNLLTVILSYTELALKTLRQGDPLEDDLREVHRAAERGALLTRQLLAFGRKQVLEPRRLDLNQVMGNMERMLRRIIGEDIELVHVGTPGLGLVIVDPGQMEQVLMNLVVNARDAMPGGGSLTIETSNVELDEVYAARHVTLQPGRYVQLAVTDTGVGMAPETLARIFEPFFTTKETGKGTGLGLSTVYGIVNQSGGSIWVYSELGEGTTFKIYLPREVSVSVSPSEPPSAVSNAGGSETILVVEDEEALRKIAHRILGAAGYTVLTAADGAEALRIVAQHEGAIDLLLTDVIMPQMSGSALVAALSKTQPTLRFLFMSGYATDAIVHHGVLDAATPFLSKPFNAADLKRKVRQVLDAGTPTSVRL